MTAIAVAALVGLYIMLRDYLFLMLALATGATTSRIGSQAQTLRFTKDGTFQLSVFSDLHYGEGECRSSSIKVLRIHGVSSYYLCCIRLSSNVSQLRISFGVPSKTSTQQG